MDSLTGAIAMMRPVMAASVFVLGVLAVVFGLVIIMSREYQETLRVLSSHSTRISGKAVTEGGMAPVLEGMARLLDAVRKLIATAVGVGAFLCLMGLGMVVLAFWMVSSL